MNYLKNISIAIPLLLISVFAMNKKTTEKIAPTAELVWLTNLEEAQKISKKTKKPILANFTGSDWCGWCHKLSAEVFNTPDFKTWSDKNVVLLELDYPRTKVQTEELKAQNNGLMQAFQVQGFPTIWVFNVDVNKETKKFNIVQIGKTGYMRGGPQAFTDAIDSMIKQFNDAKKTSNQLQKVKS
jgi:thioredoxin-related protein